LFKFQNIIERENPLEQVFPGEWDANLNIFEKLLVYKAIRPDYLSNAIKNYVKTEMGSHFVNPPLFRIEEGFNNSTKETPLIFIITPGCDPLSELINFAEKRRDSSNSLK